MVTAASSARANRRIFTTKKRTYNPDSTLGTEQKAGNPQDGLKPAQHMSWAELFDSHGSNLQQHYEILDKIRRCTAEGSDNWRIITTMSERTLELIKEFRKTTKDFVPVTDRPYQLPFVNAPKESSVDQTPSTNVDTMPLRCRTTIPPQAESNPYFIIDSKPTPVNMLGILPKLPKRRTSGDSFGRSQSQRAKKAKTIHDGVIPDSTEAKVEYEDITAEVDRRIKEKTEKRKTKGKEKKRKRESSGSTFAQETHVESGATNGTTVEATMKKKSKNINTEKDQPKGSGPESMKEQTRAVKEDKGDDGNPKRRSKRQKNA